MKEILSFIFDMATDPLTLPIEPLKEWIILGVIGLIAYAASFRIVGDLYASGDISGRTAGSVLHWIIRLLIFVPVWFVTYWVIVIGQWIKAHFALTMGILGIAITLAVATVFLFRHHNINVSNRTEGA